MLRLLYLLANVLESVVYKYRPLNENKSKKELNLKLILNLTQRIEH